MRTLPRHWWMPRAWKASAMRSHASAVSGKRQEPRDGSPDACATTSPRNRPPTCEPSRNTGVTKRKSAPSADSTADVDTTFIVDAGKSRTFSRCVKSGSPVRASTTYAPASAPSASRVWSRAFVTPPRVLPGEASGVGGPWAQADRRTEAVETLANRRARRMGAATVCRAPGSVIVSGRRGRAEACTGGRPAGEPGARNGRGDRLFPARFVQPRRVP
ncbi:hypothetical protein COSO111634_37190 [Corallococcus soli]